MKALSSILLLLISACYSNMILSWPKPVAVSSPIQLENDGVIVEKEILNIECKDSDTSCVFLAQYFLKGFNKNEYSGMFYGHDVDSINVYSKSKLVNGKLDEEIVKEIDSLFYNQLNEDSRYNVLFMRNEKIKRQGFKTKPMSLNDTIIATGTSTLRCTEQSRGIMTKPLDSRHIIFNKLDEDCYLNFSYILGPIKTFKKTGPIEIKLKIPKSWELRTSINKADSTNTHNIFKHTYTYKDSIPFKFDIRFRKKAKTYDFGGVYAGFIYGNIDQFQFRGGYEFGFLKYGVGSIAFESDFNDVYRITPEIMGMTPLLLIIPNIGAGLGVPIQFKEETEFGLRVKVEVSYPLIGIGGFGDIYKNDNSINFFLNITI